MNKKYTTNINLSEFKLLKEKQKKRNLLSITLEITARCNNNCRHCYVNLPENDKKAMAIEMKSHEIKETIDEAASLGALWCSFTGGEPMLRDDFFDLYLYAKKRGLLTSVLTNATLITGEHIDLFKRFPPRNLEISVYGISQKTYERVSGIKGSFEKFESGTNMLIKNKIPVSLKAPALQSNYNEYKEIIDFCRKYSREQYVRFDPLLFLRADKDKVRNRLINAERLSPEKLLRLKELYFTADAGEKIIDKECLQDRSKIKDCFFCNGGNNSCKIRYDAYVFPCTMFNHHKSGYDLRKGSLTKAWSLFFPEVTEKYLQNVQYPVDCSECEKIENCLWCPAISYLEHNSVDRKSDYVCALANFL